MVIVNAHLIACGHTSYQKIKKWNVCSMWVIESVE